MGYATKSCGMSPPGYFQVIKGTGTLVVEAARDEGDAIYEMRDRRQLRALALSILRELNFGTHKPPQRKRAARKAGR